jgi:hypothetical protein
MDERPKEIITLAVDERKKSIEAAIAIYRDQLAKAKAALRDILADSEAALQKQAAQMSILQQIKITHASFRYSTSTSLKEPVISFTIANGGPVPLKRIFVAGKLQTPGRAIPWVDREFNYELPGGLEPKETQALSLSPNMFSEWGRVSEEAIDGAVLTLDLIAFEDAGGKRIGKGDANSATLNREKALEAGIGELESRIVGLDKQGSFSAPDPALVMSPPPTKEQHIESGSATEISPNTDHALAAFERAKAAGTVQAWDAFLQLFDTGPLVQQAQEERKKLVAVSAPERLNSEGPATKAATIPSPTAPPDTEQSKWNITESKSPVDDSPEISAMLFSERGKAALALRCKEKKTEAVIVPDAFIGSSETLRVLYRINDGKATEARWHPSTSGKGAFVPNAVSFIKLLPDDGDLFVRVHDFQGSGHDASFRLGAVSDVRSKIATLCRWPTVPKSPTASVSATATRPSPKKPLKPTVETLSAPTPLR